MEGSCIEPKDAQLLERIGQGKDELNLAEFPLSAIAERLDDSVKTLVFEDKIFDTGRGVTVTRQLTITASEEYGLPTALDDEVILGLVQLSKLTNFADRRVSFSRYQLLKVLGWKINTRNYERLETSLKRWLGVTLYYKNAWWDREEKSWVDEDFHIIDNVTLYDRERAARRRESGQSSLPLSSFTWNEVLFRSFNNGNLKSLDFDFYKNLESSIAKRIYRFLDKRFFHRKRWEFDLKEFSWEHIGLARSYDTANLKRKLIPAIQELERSQFLKPMPPEQRFQKAVSGTWWVFFERQRAEPRGTSKIARDQKQPLIDALMARGVTPSTAAKTAARFSESQIATQIEVFDWYMSQPLEKQPRNPPGFLIESIKGEYAAPKNFETKEDAAKRQTAAEEKKRKAEEKARLEQEREAAKKQAKDVAIRNFWQKHSEGERKRMEAEALEEASTQEQLVINRGGPMAKVVRKHILDKFAIKVMQMAA